MTGSQFIDFIKKEFNSGALLNSKIELWVADEDGDLDDDYPQPESDQILSKMGLDNFYLKIKDADTQARQSIANSFRKSVATLYVYNVIFFSFSILFLSCFVSWMFCFFCFFLN